MARTLEKSSHYDLLARIATLETQVEHLRNILENQLTFLAKSPQFRMNQRTNIVEFKLDTHFFCFRIEDIKEIIRIIAITKVPKSPDFIEGVINFRGEIVPVVDIRKRAGLNKKEYELDFNIIIFNVADFNAALVVDEVLDVSSVDIEEVGSSVEAPLQKSFIFGMVKRKGKIIMIIDPQMLLSVREHKKIEKLLSEKTRIDRPKKKEKKTEIRDKKSKKDVRNKKPKK